MIRAAQYYAGERRWRVFITTDDCRTPIKDPTFEHGVHDATNDPTEVERRLAQYPNANLALACGRASGVLALDIDRKGEVDGFAQLARLEAEFEPLPVTPRSETPSGGAHLLFRFPIGVDPRNRVGIKRYDKDGNRTVYAGLDVRANGASIALPPSRKPTGAYSWTAKPSETPLAPVPRWLLALMLSEPPPRPPAPKVRLSSTDKAARYVGAAIDRECGNLARMGPNSGRNLALFQAAANLGELVGAGVLSQDMAEHALEIAAHDNGLVSEDGMHAVRASIRSGMTKGMAKPRELSL